MPLDTSPQVLHNRFLSAETQGFDPQVYGVSIDEFVEHLSRMVHPQFYQAAKQVHPQLWEAFEAHCQKGATVRELFADNLERTLHPRENFGLDLDWRFSQRECLEGLIQAYRLGYARPAFEVPMGVGKSLIFGAAARAYLETVDQLHGQPGFENLKAESEVYLFTSRVALTKQFVRSRTAEVLLADEFDEESDAKPIKMGDITVWTEGILDAPEAQTRVLAGNLGSKGSELGKNSRVTISTYAGLTARRINQVFRKKGLPLVAFDEAHRVTDRVRTLVNQSFLKGGPWVAGSGTIVGPGRKIYDIWERVEQPGIEAVIPEWHDGLAHHTSLVEAIARGEAPPIRYLEMEPQIDISEANGASRRDLNHKAVDELLSLNVNGLKSFLKELLLSDHPVLNLSESKGVLERSWLAFVTRVAIAEQLTDFINGELQSALTEKGSKPFRAAFVSGEMTEKAYNKVIEDFEAGKIQVIFSCEKIGEGADIRGVSGIMPLRPYGLNSEWKLKQEIGRGRINPANPDQDLLVVDGMFHSKRHQLASVMGILGQHRTVSGGLLAGNLDRIKAERKVYKLISQGLAWNEIWEKMTPQERELMPFVSPSKTSEVLSPGFIDERAMAVEIVKVVERDDVFLNLASLSPQKAREFARLILRRRFPNTQAFHRALEQPSFAQMNLGMVGTGMELINLVLGTNQTRLNGRLINDFKSMIGEIMEIELVDPMEKAEVFSLQSFFALHFGKVPAPGVREKQGYFSGQVSLLIQGEHYASPILNAADALSAEGAALAALKEQVETVMCEQNNFLGSRVNNATFANAIGALHSISQVMGVSVEFKEGPLPVPGDDFICQVSMDHKALPVMEGRGKKKIEAKRDAAQKFLHYLFKQARVETNPEDKATIQLVPATPPPQLAVSQEPVEMIERPPQALIYTTNHVLPDALKLQVYQAIKQRLGIDPQHILPMEHRPDYQIRSVDIEGETFVEVQANWGSLKSELVYVPKVGKGAQNKARNIALMSLIEALETDLSPMSPITEANFHPKTSGSLDPAAVSAAIKANQQIQGKLCPELSVDFLSRRVQFENDRLWECRGQWNGQETAPHYSKDYRAAQVQVQADLIKLIQNTPVLPKSPLTSVEPPAELVHSRNTKPTSNNDLLDRLYLKLKERAGLGIDQVLPEDKSYTIHYREVLVNGKPYWEYQISGPGIASQPHYAVSAIIARDWAAQELLDRL